MEDLDTVSVISQRTLQTTDIFRCEKCPLIPRLELAKQENKIVVKYFCLNNHEGVVELDKFIDHKLDFNEQTCSLCKEKNQNSNTFSFCFECSAYVCADCIKNEKHDSKHKKILCLNKLDSYCPVHDDRFFGFCEDCKQNICNNCNDDHEGHKINYFFNINIKRNQVVEYKNAIKHCEDIIANVEKEKEKVILFLNEFIKSVEDSFKKFKDINEKEVKFTKDLLSIYQLKNKDLNYQIINNVKSVFHFEDIKITSLDKSMNDVKYFVRFMDESYVLKASGANKKTVNNSLTNLRKNETKKTETKTIPKKNEFIYENLTKSENFNQTLTEGGQGQNGIGNNLSEEQINNFVNKLKTELGNLFTPDKYREAIIKTNGDYEGAKTYLYKLFLPKYQ